MPTVAHAHVYRSCTVQARHCAPIDALAAQEQVDIEQCKGIFPYGLPIVEVSAPWRKRHLEDHRLPVGSHNLT